MPTFELRQWLKEKTHKRSPWGERLDSNGYAESVWDTENEEGRCFYCFRRTETARHEVYFGTADRKTSKATGCWVYVCPECHNKIHGNGKADKALKNFTEKVFIQRHSYDEFITLFGRDYL